MVLVWTLVCARTLGVPHDMVLRARRVPDVADRVDLLAHIAAERLAGLGDMIGVPVAGLVGFGLAMLAGIGFVYDIELAQAVFVLLAPLAWVALGMLRLARVVRAEGSQGEVLRRYLSNRRLWNQVIAILSMGAAVVLALGHHPNVMWR